VDPHWPDVGSEAYGRFAKYYDLVYADLPYEADCDFLESVFRKFLPKRPASVLDVACGTGPHAVILGRRGYAVTGLDLSPGQLRLARAKVRGTRLPVAFVRGDIRRFDLGRSFDAAVCMFGGFGYLLSDRDVLAHFRSVRRHLGPRGVYVFESWQESGVKPGHRSWLHRQKPFRLIRLDESHYDPKRHRLPFDLHFFVFEGNRLKERFTESHTIRLYRLAEIWRLIARAGLRLAGAYAGDGERKGFRPVRRGTFRVMAVAEPAR